MLHRMCACATAACLCSEDPTGAWLSGVTSSALPRIAVLSKLSRSDVNDPHPCASPRSQRSLAGRSIYNCRTHASNPVAARVSRVCRSVFVRDQASDIFPSVRVPHQKMDAVNAFKKPSWVRIAAYRVPPKLCQQLIERRQRNSRDLEILSQVVKACKTHATVQRGRA
jgi:hypothetical protein